MTSNAIGSPRYSRKAIIRMEEDERNSVLSRKLKCTKKQTLRPYKKQFFESGETQYDFSIRKRSKCSYSIKKEEDNNENQSSTPEVRESENSSISTNVELLLPPPSPPPPPPSLSSLSEQNAFEHVIQHDSFFSEDELYKNLLCTDPATITISDGAGLFMVLPDLNYVKAQFKKDHLILVERRAVSFRGESYRWIYTCSCQPIWSREINSSSTQYCISYNEFLSIYPQCIHRKIGATIYEKYDILHQIEPGDYFVLTSGGYDHGYASHEPEIEEATRLNSVPVVRIWSDNLRCNGLVTAQKNSLYCYCCERNYCDHVRKVKNIITQHSCNEPYPPVIEELAEFVKHETATTFEPTKNKVICHSYKKISFEPTTESVQCFQQNIINNLDRHDGSIIFVPKDVACRHCGSSLHNGDPVSNGWIASKDAIIITNTYFGTGTVYYRPCLQCNTVTLFDGLDKCVLNMGTFLVGHDVLRLYMHNFLHGRRPLYTFYSVFVDSHRDYGNNISDIFSYHKLRAAWLSYLKLLDINYTEGFSCPDCPGDGPDIIICDGTSVSFQRRMWSWHDQGGGSKNVIKKKSSFIDRVFLQDETTRKLLYRFAAGGDTIRGKRSKVLNEEEKADLFKKITNYPTLHIFLKSIDDGSVQLPKKFRNFITSLSSKSPVCGYIHPTKEVYCLIMDLINGVKVKNDPQKWQDLHNFLPILFDVLEQTDCASAPAEMCPLLEELWELAISPFNDKVEENTAVFNEDEMSFFPNLPMCRPRGTYEMDSTRVDKSCSKSYQGHPALLPGIFTVYCPHGICYGFQLMPTNESPNIPFTILLTRFRKAPSIVIYDNACALHAYCLNRDPTFFQNTVFLVDRLHWDNHTGCSCGYCLDLYPTLKDINSQTNEQANAGLKRIKDQLSYMTAENFMQHCSFYLWDKNKRKMQKQNVCT